MSNISGGDGDDGSFSSEDKQQELKINKFPVSGASNTIGSSSSSQQPLQGGKRKRNLPGTPGKSHFCFTPHDFDRVRCMALSC